MSGRITKADIGKIYKYKTGYGEDPTVTYHRLVNVGVVKEGGRRGRLRHTFRNLETGEEGYLNTYNMWVVTPNMMVQTTLDYIDRLNRSIESSTKQISDAAASLPQIKAEAERLRLLIERDNEMDSKAKE